MAEKKGESVHLILLSPAISVEDIFFTLKVPRARDILCAVAGFS
jgi:hypothetical protein